MNISRWSPTIAYAIIAVFICLNHIQNVNPVLDKLAEVETQFTATHHGLMRGEQLSPVAQQEMARLGAHHIHHSKDFVSWTTRAFWWLTLPGIAVAVLQGYVCSRYEAAKRQ